MAFTLLPAVDVAGGRAVRLVQAETGTETAHGDPLAVALGWQAEGAEWIHLVDLDAAFGRGSNHALLTAVVDQLDIDVQFSGGIRDDESLRRALSTGCSRVVLATQALDDLDFCRRAIAASGDRVAVALDVRAADEPTGSRYRLAARGTGGGDGDLWDALARLDEFGCARYIVTDVSKDGTLRGPNLELYRAVTRATAVPVIASGGISTVADLVALAAGAGGVGLAGAIVGKALDVGRFTLPEALSAVSSRPGAAPVTN